MGQLVYLAVIQRKGARKTGKEEKSVVSWLPQWATGLNPDEDPSELSLWKGGWCVYPQTYNFVC